VPIPAKFASHVRRVSGQHFADVGLEQIVPPGRPGSFFKEHVQAATHTADKLENCGAFSPRMASITNLPAESKIAEIVAW